jgi:hypothetical protein
VDEPDVRTRRHESGLGWMKHVSGTPHPILRPHVRRNCGYDERTSHPVRRRELPSVDVTVILSLGPELRLVEPRPARHTSFVAGLDERSAVTEHDGEAAGVEVDLTPLGAHRFFREPMHTLARRVVELDDVLGREADLLVERLHDTPSWPTRFRILDDAIRAHLADAPEPSPDVAWAAPPPRRDRPRLRLLRPGPPEPRFPLARRQHAERAPRPALSQWLRHPARVTFFQDTQDADRIEGGR